MLKVPHRIKNLGAEVEVAPTLIKDNSDSDHLWHLEAGERTEEYWLEQDKFTHWAEVRTSRPFSGINAAFSIAGALARGVSALAAKTYVRREVNAASVPGLGESYPFRGLIVSPWHDRFNGLHVHNDVDGLVRPDGSVDLDLAREAWLRNKFVQPLIVGLSTTKDRLSKCRGSEQLYYRGYTRQLVERGYDPATFELPRGEGKYDIMLNFLDSGDAVTIENRLSNVLIHPAMAAFMVAFIKIATGNPPYGADQYPDEDAAVNAKNRDVQKALNHRLRAKIRWGGNIVTVGGALKEFVSLHQGEFDEMVLANESHLEFSEAVREVYEAAVSNNMPFVGPYQIMSELFRGSRDLFRGYLYKVFMESQNKPEKKFSTVLHEVARKAPNPLDAEKLESLAVFYEHTPRKDLHVSGDDLRQHASSVRLLRLKEKDHLLITGNVPDEVLSKVIGNRIGLQSTPKQKPERVVSCCVDAGRPDRIRALLDNGFMLIEGNIQAGRPFIRFEREFNA